MKLAGLYLRSRGAPGALVLLVVVSILGGVTASYLVSRPQLDGTARLPVAVGAALAAVLVLGATLPSAAAEIEAATPRSWRRWRAGHAVAAVVVAVAVLTPSLPVAEFGEGALVRNTLGLWGLTLVAASLLGGSLAWTLPMGYGFAVYLGAGRSTGRGQQMWAFIMAPAGDRAALVTAVLLLTAGTTAWTVNPWARSQRD